MCGGCLVLLRSLEAARVVLCVRWLDVELLGGRVAAAFRLEAMNNVH